MAAALQGLPVRLDRAPQRGAAFALTRASRRARTRSIGSRSRARGFALTRASRRARTRSIGSRSRARGSLLIFYHPPAVVPAPPPPPGPTRYHFARDHRLPNSREPCHLLRR